MVRTASGKLRPRVRERRRPERRVIRGLMEGGGSGFGVVEKNVRWVWKGVSGVLLGVDIAWLMWRPWVGV